MKPLQAVRVKRKIAGGVHPWAIFTREINPKLQRTVCPFCQVQLVEFSGHFRKCHKLNVLVKTICEVL